MRFLGAEFAPVSSGCWVSLADAFPHVGDRFLPGIVRRADLRLSGHCADIRMCVASDRFDRAVPQPYPKWIAQFLRGVVPLTVIISLTAVYALWMRRRHYGLTVERVWAFVVAGDAPLASLRTCGI